MSAPVTAQLILISGDSTFQSVIELHSVNRSIGRGQNCDIVWGSLQISRKHATLEYRLPKWYIRDTSTNGLSVNGSKCVKGEAMPLNDADIISFIPTGTVRYRFRYIYNSPARRALQPQREGPITISSSSPQPSTSRATTALSAVGRNRPSIEEVILDNPSSDSEESHHSESLLDVDPPDDFFSFSGPSILDDDNDLLSPSALADSDDSLSSGGFSSKRKHAAESDSDINSMDRKKKRMNSPTVVSDEESNGSSSNQKSDNNPESKSSNSNRLPTIAGCMTDEQISNCDNISKLRTQLRQCMTKLARTECKLKEVECERVMEREEYDKRENDVESMKTAIKEENYKKILELLESELSCAVCNDVFIQATVVDCGHTFCGFCISEWGRKKQECPICRKPFRNKSRHIELENFITKTFDSFNEEISSKRKITITEREEQAKKADADRVAQTSHAQARLGNPPNLHTFMQRTAETYVDFLAELHQFNEFLPPPAHARMHAAARVTARGDAADRRRSARIQVRGVAPTAAGADGNDAGRVPTRRGRAARSRGNIPTIPPNPTGLNVPPPPAPLLRQQVPIPTAAVRGTERQNNGIPVVDLDESQNRGEANLSQFARIPNQFLNLLF